MTYKIITAVSSPVIPLADVRLHLRLDLLGGSTHPDDTLIEGYLGAARDYCEHYTQRSIGAQTLEVALDAFPNASIELPLGAASITSITYLDNAGVLQTLASNQYLLNDYTYTSCVYPVTTWPTAGEYTNAVKVRYVTPATFKPAVKSAMLLLVAHWYENREASGIDKLASIPLGVKGLLDTVDMCIL